MQRRKTIAVIAADITNDYMNSIFVGISEQSKALDYDVYAFVMAFSIDGGGQIQYGEENIFNLLCKEAVDGVILLAGNFAGQTLVEKIKQKVIDLGLPVISLDFDYDFCESIYAEDSSVIEQMTDHLIEHHGCKDIICLTGPKDSPPAVTRLNGYISSMEKHGFEVRDENIVYGDFWKPAASHLAKEISGGKRPIPDAVVCANDVMAMHLCNELIGDGVKIPEQVKITGYDCSREACDNLPSISTIFPENSHLGSQAVCRIHELITGEKTKPVNSNKGSLILAQSCGCNDGLGFLVRNREYYNRNVERYERFYHKSGMIEGLMQCESLEDLLRRVDEFAYVLNGLEIFMLCLCRNWDDVEDKEDDDYIREGYTPMMDVRIIMKEGTSELVNYEYASSRILPPVMGQYSPDPSVYFILPVHFADRCFGYSVFKFVDIRLSISNVFAYWNRDINIALEFLRVRTRLMCMNQRISMNSIRDTLTGVFNRKGFNRYSETMFKKAQTEKKPFFVMMADLDTLKTINDNYGHIEGDNAIIVAANALNTCCTNNEICCRIGGDEYAIIGVGEYTDEQIQEYFNHVDEYCERYNASSGKMYKVGVSLGFYCDVPDMTEKISTFINIADERMYENKVRRKKNRR